MYINSFKFSINNHIFMMQVDSLIENNGRKYSRTITTPMQKNTMKSNFCTYVCIVYLCYFFLFNGLMYIKVSVMLMCRESV